MYALFYKPFGGASNAATSSGAASDTLIDEQEWKCYKQWTKSEWHQEIEHKLAFEKIDQMSSATSEEHTKPLDEKDIQQLDEEPMITKEIKLMVDQGNYTSWKIINVYGYPLFTSLVEE